MHSIISIKDHTAKICYNIAMAGQDIDVSKIPKYIKYLGCQNGSYPIDNKLKAVNCSHSQNH
jgi:hypothetical protein